MYSPQSPADRLRTFLKSSGVLSKLLLINVLVWFLVNFGSVIAFLFREPGKDTETIWLTFITNWLALPAMTGWLLHAPLYYPIRWITHRKAAGTGHYDSIMVGLLFLLYPVYLLFAALLCWKVLDGYWWPLVFVVMPFTAWSFVQWKERF